MFPARDCMTTIMSFTNILTILTLTSKPKGYYFRVLTVWRDTVIVPLRQTSLTALSPTIPRFEDTKYVPNIVIPLVPVNTAHNDSTISVKASKRSTLNVLSQNSHHRNR